MLLQPPIVASLAPADSAFVTFHQYRFRGSTCRPTRLYTTPPCLLCGSRERTEKQEHEIRCINIRALCLWKQKEGHRGKRARQACVHGLRPHSMFAIIAAIWSATVQPTRRLTILNALIYRRIAFLFWRGDITERVLSSPQNEAFP